MTTLRRSTLLLLAALLCATGFGACSPDDPFVPKPRPVVVEKKGAWLRVIHAAYDDPTVHVWVGDSLLFQQPQRYLKFDASVGNEAKYYPVDTAAHSIRFTLGDASVVAKVENVQLVEDAFYTVYLYGKPGDHRALLTADSIEAPLANDPQPAKMRVVHLSPDAPMLTVRLDSATATPMVEGLEYGRASAYARHKEVPLTTGTSLHISRYPTNEGIFTIPDGFRLLTAQTMTVVITGSVKPSGDEPLLQFTTFLESVPGDDSLRGSTLIPFVLGAQRLINISSSGDSLLDVTYLEERESYKQEFAFNAFFRRTNYSATPDRVNRIGSLGNPAFPWTRPYRYETHSINGTEKYRVEYHEPWGPKPTSVEGKPNINPAALIDYRRQDVFAPQNSFSFQANRRYTFVAYGEYRWPNTSGKSTVLLDNTAQPPGGMAQVRLFHGAFGTLESKRLKLRINGATTPTAVSYGEATQGSNSVAVPAGAITAEVIDEDGNVVHSQTLITNPTTGTGLQGGTSYTVFFSRGYKGDTLYLHPISEELLLE